MTDADADAVRAALSALASGTAGRVVDEAYAALDRLVAKVDYLEEESRDLAAMLKRASEERHAAVRAKHDALIEHADAVAALGDSLVRVHGECAALAERLSHAQRFQVLEGDPRRPVVERLSGVVPAGWYVRRTDGVPFGAYLTVAGAWVDADRPWVPAGVDCAYLSADAAFKALDEDCTGGGEGTARVVATEPAAVVDSACREGSATSDEGESVPAEAVVRAVERLLLQKFAYMRAWLAEDVREHAVETARVRLSIPIDCALPERVERGRARNVLLVCDVYDEGEMDEILDRVCDEVAEDREKTEEEGSR